MRRGKEAFDGKKKGGGGVPVTNVGKGETIKLGRESHAYD